MTVENAHLKSKWWYLFPILLGIIGGVIAYFLIRHDDPKKAKNCIIIGIILTVGEFFVPIAASLIAFGI